MGALARGCRCAYVGLGRLEKKRHSQRKRTRSDSNEQNLVLFSKVRTRLTITQIVLIVSAVTIS